jgi:muramoyltetrapeptide carboxypeptidase LdcA involved in peptidoglycan recycling
MAPPTLVTPPACQPGDRVAILSPSWGGPGIFPAIHERGLRVLTDEFDLIAVEFPTTRQVDASPQARAADLMAAFADPTITAILATIGGDDQIAVLPHLDPGMVVARPTRFFGYSDNTNLLNWLWRQGVVGYHGGSTMVHLARAGGPHPVSVQSLRDALFGRQEVPITPVDEFTDLHPDWSDLSTLEVDLPGTVESGWTWHNATTVVTGATWGGNLEILHWNLAADRWIGPVDDYTGCVLILETSEEMPTDEEVFRMLRNAGERGLLQQFPAIVVAKPKAWDRDTDQSETQRAQYRAAQEAAVLRALSQYHADAMVVFGPDFGHTDPQYVLPYGGVMTVDGPGRRLTVSY